MADIQISDDRARSFADALQTFEKDGDAAAFAALFDSISTTFYDVVEGGDRVALEWSSDATLTDGRPITYRGVTVIDLDGDKVSRLRTYYDSAQFTATTATTA